MISLALALTFGAVLWVVLSATGEAGEAKTSLSRVLMGGYALRLIVQYFIRDVAFFSHGAGGDSGTYEELGQIIATIWRVHGIHFVTASEFPAIGPTSLPQNLFALLIYLNGGDATRLACTALVALAAGLTALNVYALSVQFGAEPKRALRFMSIIYFQPAFLFYTCDSYKDGLVLCLAMAAFGSALRLSFRFSFLHLAIGILAAWALWYVRFYLVFVTTAPLLVGVVGIGSKSIVRPMFAALSLVLVGLVLATFTDFLQTASARASDTFQLGTSGQVLQANSLGGSGVVFDDGGLPYGALPAKLAYTLFSPFPWATGSLGFQIGKLDAFLWYFIVYRAIRAISRADRRLVLMVATFVVPCTLMYAMSMANVGLIVRQRLIIVVATTLLATIYAPNQTTAKRVATARSLRPSRREGLAA
jgi:hypothetical protein